MNGKFTNPLKKKIKLHNIYFIYHTEHRVLLLKILPVKFTSIKNRCLLQELRGAPKYTAWAKRRAF